MFFRVLLGFKQKTLCDFLIQEESWRDKERGETPPAERMLSEVWSLLGTGYVIRRRWKVSSSPTEPLGWGNP